MLRRGSRMNSRQQYPFEKLRVWQAARDLSKAVYLITEKFPLRELYCLISQCNRAAISVAANLAEGSSRRSRKDQAHFSEIAYGSLMELACLLILSRDLGILSDASEKDFRSSIEQLSSQLTVLHCSQRSRIE